MCASLLAAALALGCGSSGGGESRAALCSAPLTGVVNAPKWVRQRAGIAAYEYTLDPATDTATRVTLLSASGRALGTIEVAQLYGDASRRDGTLRAVLSRDGEERMRLFSRGKLLEAERYEVRAELARDSVHLGVRARFVRQACFDTDTQPACAGTLPLDERAYTLPSCGLLFDRAVLDGEAPTLDRLVYAANGASDRPFAADGPLDLLAVQAHGERLEPKEVERWAADHGVDGLLGSDDERLLTTAFLDRTWWRAVEQHVSVCLDPPEGTDALPDAGAPKLRPARCASDGPRTKAAAQAPLCNSLAGRPSDSDWSDGSHAGGSSGFWGDPHMTSLDGTHFNFQGAGEFLLLETKADPPLTVQARFEPIETRHDIEACADVSVGTALAVTDGETSVVAYTRPDWRVTLNGAEVPSDRTVALSAGTVALTGRSMTIELDSGDRVEFGGRRTTRLQLHLSAARRDAVRGMLGQYDGDDGNDFVTRDGALLPASLDHGTLYDTFGDSWRITPGESLFDYAAGQSTATFTDRAFPSTDASLDDLPEKEREAARETCAARQVTDPSTLADCILDVVCLGDGAADAAHGQAAPESQLPPALSGVFVRGDLRVQAMPEAINTSPYPTAERGKACVPLATPVAFVQQERAAVTLGGDVDVSTSAPGVYASASDLVAATISADARVQSWLITRRPGALDEPLSGSVRFARPILGVIVGDDALSATDAIVGSATTKYPSSRRDLELGEDSFSIGGDGRSLAVHLGGDSADELRVLTEAP